jgi:hypothetical protein
LFPVSVFVRLLVLGCIEGIHHGFGDDGSAEDSLVRRVDGDENGYQLWTPDSLDQFAA